MNFDEKVVDRIKKLEREVERLRVKESPGAWQSWTPTVTGWAAGYTCKARYCKVGKLCFVYLYISGTSDAVNARATLPLTVSGEPDKANIQVPVYTNNSVTDLVGGKCLAQVRPTDQPAGNQVWFWLDGSENGWTASGTKTVTASFFYEVA